MTQQEASTFGPTAPDVLPEADSLPVGQVEAGRLASWRQVVKIAREPA